MRKRLRIVHKNGVNYVAESASMDEDGSLVRFYVEDILVFAVPREDFLFVEVALL